MKKPPSSNDALAAFDPLVARWFRSTLGEPGEVQVKAWAALGSRSHVLACAPTGSGKTLAAFLGALNALITGEYPLCELSVLYVSPLKALNSDIRRNLTEPLAAIRVLFDAEGKPFPPITVSVRSGDTSQAERRSFLKNPPEILATTPESLALILNSPRARETLMKVKLVVLDEIHALEPNKRGSFLMAQLERLVCLCGEFRRIALSATVADPVAMAAYVAGFDSAGVPRPISVVHAGDEKRFRVDIKYPPPLPNLSSQPDPDSVSRWKALTDAFLHEVSQNRTTLIFVNSRRHAEKIAFLMNERAGEELAWAHHGSLSREVRTSIEERLKRGLLKAVVATGSLELGIDIGSVDKVVLAGTPFGAAETMQRIGRAGHQLGAESKAVMFPLHPFDLLLAAATLRDVRDRRLEKARRPDAPLDVLAQLILAMTVMDDWTEEDLFCLIRRSTPFSHLERTAFDMVLEMLRGRFESARLPSLESRLDRSVPSPTLRAKRSVLPILYGSGGVIPDRGSFALLLAENRAPLGELDEEFVWERRIGDGFALGTRSWRIVGIDDRAVIVKPSDRGIQILPFWRAENQWRGAESMKSILNLLDEYEAASESSGEFTAAAELGMDAQSAAELIRFLGEQRTSCPLPLSRRVVAEDFSGPGGQGRYSFLHTLRGGRVNAALGIALRVAADLRYGADTIEFFWDDSGILASFTAAEEQELSGNAFFRALFDDLHSGGLASFLSRSLESTGLFGAAFRENAGRALLLPKAPFGKRTPLWMTRLRSKRLYEAVRLFPDFPIVRETWRTCLKDILDPENAALLLADIVSGRIEFVFHSSAAPSAFARGSIWIASDSFMYRRDDGGGESATDEDVIKSLLASDTETPRVASSVVQSVLSRVKRLHPDYLPRDGAELADWLDERLLIDEDEWAALKSAAGIELEIQVDSRRFSDSSPAFVASPDLSVRLLSETELLSHWMRYEGPVTEERVCSLFGPDGADALQELTADQSLVRLRIDEGERSYCDAELASRLLRVERTTRRAERARGLALEAPLCDLQPLVARQQGILGFRDEEAGRASDIDRSLESLKTAFDPLLGVSSQVELWERDILPARTAYLPYHLDLLMDRFPLIWYGSGDRKVGFTLEAELRYSDISAAFTPPSPEVSQLLERVRGGRADSMNIRAAVLCEAVAAGLLRSDRFGSAKRFFADSVTTESGKTVFPSAGSKIPYGAPRPRGAFPARDRWERAKKGPLGSMGDRLILIDRRSEDDLLDREGALRERVRRMLSRYGVLFRSLAALDEGALPWTDVFRVLRLMEFSGETVGGRFFSGVDELQFRFSADAEAVETVPDCLYCLCARDPASLCGLSQLSVVLDLPARIASNHVVWRGARPVLISRRNGRELDFRVPSDSPEVGASIDLLCNRLAGRSVDPVFPFTVERIGEAPPRHSPYSKALLARGFVESLKGLEYIARPLS
ncbi:MAG: DEAD/DEAH box helicase [Treponemataceae bacterium]